MLAKLDLDDLMLEKRGSFGFTRIGPYSNSKIGNMYFAKELGKRLEGTGVTTYALCPGKLHCVNIFEILRRIRIDNFQHIDY
jgi:NAD(P)-dependent dehydrogenase (short-subunit alcohol dehydrogenase family)